MTTGFRYFAILLSRALALVACQLTQQVWKQPARPASVATDSPEKDIPVDKASQAEQGNPDPSAWDKPLQSQAAEVRPNEMRTKLTHLSKLLDYQVLDANGDTLGVASDYIVNTCEGLDYLHPDGAGSQP